MLNEPGAHVGQAHTPTGPEAFDYYRVASMLSARLGRVIRYEPIGLLRYREEFRVGGLPGGHVNVQLLINVICRAGLASWTTDMLPRLPGRPAGTLDSYIADHVDPRNATHDQHE